MFDNLSVFTVLERRSQLILSGVLQGSIRSDIMRQVHAADLARRCRCILK